MKTLRRFTRTRVPSHLRIPIAVTLIAAAVVSAIASFKPDPPPPSNSRLTNDNGANGGYVSDFTFVTGQAYTDALLTACSPNRGRPEEPPVAGEPPHPPAIAGSSKHNFGGVAAGPPQV